MHDVGEEYTKLLERFAKLPHNAEAKVSGPFYYGLLL